MQSLRKQRQPIGSAAEPIEQELARVRQLDVHQLRGLWRTITRQTAPKALSRDLLARAIAYRIQEERLGGLGRETRTLLGRLACGEDPVRRLKIGSVLVREHAGTLHQVMVVPGGFAWGEKTYASLSTVARAITGTSWNGPRFFGLRGNTRDEVASQPAVTVPDPPRASSRSSVRARGEVRRSGEPHP